MSNIGMNVSADGRHDAASLAALRCTWARIFHRRYFDISTRLAEYRHAGISVLLGFDRTSVDEYPSAADAFADALRRYGQWVAAWQIGNEPDGEGESSWTMSQDDFTMLGRTARACFPNRLIVAGGMVSGQPSWLAGQDLSWCDLLDAHLYLKDAPNPNDIEDVPDIDVALPGYQALGKPVILGEWGYWGDDEQRGAEEVADMVGWVAPRTDVPLFFYFCADDAMVAPFGLMRADGSLKPAYGAFRRQAANAVPAPLPTPGQVTEPVPEPEPVPAAPSADPWKWFTAEQIAAATECPVDAVRDTWPRLVEQLDHCGINDRATQIAMAGTVAIETASNFRPVPEIGPDGYSWPD